MEGIAATEILQGARAAAAARGPAAPGSLAEARASAEEFEAVFLSQMMGHMFQGVGAGPFGGGQAEEVFRSLLVDQYGKLTAQAGGVGIADAVMNEILKMQEA